MKQHSYTSNSKAKTRRVYLSRFAVFALLFVIMLIVAQLAVVLLERICDDRSSTQKISKYQIEDFYALDTKEWIHFVLKITNAVEKREKKTVSLKAFLIFAKELMQNMLIKNLLKV